MSKERDLKVLEAHKDKIIKGLKNFKKSPKDRITRHYVEARLEALESQFQQFSSLHENSLGEYGSEEITQHFEDEEFYETVFEHYLDYKVELKKALSNIKSVDRDVSNATPDNTVKLPRISLPTFSGKYTEWSSFRDWFISLVHKNKNLDDVQRLHYLKTQLSGEAEQLIRHIPITDHNYLKCWETLEHRYNNKKFMSSNILNRLFSQRSMTVESSTMLKELRDVTCDCLHELSNIGIDVSTWDVIVIYIISLKLDAETRKQWELHVNQSADDLPSFDQFCSFLEMRFRALENIEPKGKPKVSSTNKSHAYVMHSVTQLSCPHCSENHKLFNCKEFCKEDCETRRALAQSLQLCFNCLGVNHTSKNCRVFTKCRICQRKHHTLLHPRNSSVTTVIAASRESATTHEPTLNPQEQEGASNIATHFVNARGQVLLATALLQAESRNGSYHVLRALLDQGSQASFITESAAQLLQLRKVGSKTTIAGIGGGHDRVVSRQVVTLKVRSIPDPSFTFEVTAHVLSSLTSVMPDTKVSLADWPALQNLTLADSTYNTPSKIDVLLGAEIYGHILKEGLIRSPKGSPVAQDTYLGWIVSGHVKGEVYSPNQHNVITAMHAQIDVNEMLTRLWELDSGSTDTKHILTPEEQACQDYYDATTKRDKSGRYIVRLPFRHKNPLCKYGNTKDIAIRRLQGIERKLAKDLELKQQYSDVLNEYLLLGHMKKITDVIDKERKEAVYLPHHAVVRKDKLTTKVRVVYDASSKGTNGYSLNDALRVGPTLQADLRHLVLKWRQHPICLTADVVKMYRQIKVADEDADFQRIVWRQDPSDDIHHFKLLTVTFGTSCAPYLAVRTLQQVAIDEGKSYPLAAKRVMSDFFMDDLMSGCQTETEAVRIYKELNELLNKGGFKLQKWTSNKVELLEGLNERSGKDLSLNLDKVTKVLGLTWNRSTDEFDYSVKLSEPAVAETKRTVISEISRLYDPLGWIAPCIITSKVFIQKLWIAGIDWDDELPPELLQEWIAYRSDLEQLIHFHIPRWIGKRDDNIAVELHGFGDASTMAYAAAVYARVIDADGNITCNLLTARTKVAPIKQISIPRLELCAAVLVAKLLTEVAEVIHIPKADLHAWTDSSVVLAWLSDHPSRWKTYIANRTSEIVSLIDRSQWAHVQSRDNPADIASRGASPAVLLESDLWKRGPSWLRQNPIEYPQPACISTLEEKKVYIAKVDSDFDERFWSRFSSLRKLIRVIAFCRRFLMMLKMKIKLTTYLSVSEFQEALWFSIKKSQQEWFGEEISNITNKQSVSKGSCLFSLNPSLDDNGLLRVGGRIRHSALPQSTKHPIVVAYKSSLAKLIVADAHEKTFHGGQQLVINYVRRRYWISRLKNMVREHIHGCVSCIRYASVTRQQLMGDLPACRVTPSRPFSNAGVDYAGPLSIRVSKGRGQRSYKGYVCLFICMATRAVHLEAVSDLTTEGFLAAFKRFVSRRGPCRNIWSDNGTNFVGAAKELRVLFAQESERFREIAEHLANLQTEWHFIPPHAPNFGGLWEAGVKSVKYHLRRVVGDTTLTYEELSTVLTQIEACLNSRPLSQGSSDLEDPEPLTPGHFLVGGPLIVPPDTNYEHSTISPLRRWQLSQRMLQGFWRRWSQEYLTQFFQRHKWAVQVPQFKVDDIVLVKEDNLPPAKWLYGRILELHPGKDNLTRVVTIRCKGTQIKRPTSKLCLLPVAT